MSYPRPDTGNTLNDFMTALSDFIALSPRLLSARTQAGFMVWLEKLEQIDRRALWLFLRAHRDEIPEEYMRLARRKFRREI